MSLVQAALPDADHLAAKLKALRDSFKAIFSISRCECILAFRPLGVSSRFRMGFVKF